jgi:hypothetical protein
MIAARSIFRFLLRFPARALGTSVCGAGVVAFWLFFTATAPATDVDLTTAALLARNEVGLPAIGQNPAVLAAAGVVLDGGKNAQGVFTSEGGSGDLITATAPAGGALSTDKLKVVVFDPRVTAIAVLVRDRRVAVAAALDPNRPFQAPVLAGAIVDPAVAGSLAVLFPPAAGTIPQISLQRYRGRQLTTPAVAATATAGVEGAILVALKGRDQVTGPQLGYGLKYTLKIANRSYTFRTREIPSELVSRSFVAGPGFTGADRARFLKTVDSLPPTARKIVDVIGGAITASVLANTAPICGAQTSCAGIDPGNGYFLILNRAQLESASGRFVIAHELGHLVDFFGLDTWSAEDFKKLFSKSPKWRNCFPLRGQCSPLLEVFADQFGFFLTNAHGVQSGYGDDRLATPSAFARNLLTQWAFRPPQDINPLAGYGPLAKSFEIALRSRAGAL